MRLLIFLYLVFLIACTTRETDQQRHWVASAPAGAEYTQINKDGRTVIPNGRLLLNTQKSMKAMRNSQFVITR